MPAFFLSLILCAFVTAAGREQMRVARLAAGFGPDSAPGLLAAIWTAAILTSAIAAWAATLLAPMLAGDAKQMLVAMALLLAGLELFFLRAGPAPKEPTRSHGAILLVLLAAQFADGTRFLVLALAVATGEPVLAAAGGALGSGLALTAACLTGKEWELRVRVRQLAAVGGAMLVIGAIFLGLSARGLLG